MIKVGTSCLSRSSGGVDEDYLASLARQVKELMDNRVQVIVVSSGAIAAGMEKLGLSSRPRQISMLQAVAAVGQGLLMNAYSRQFGKEGITVAQILLTQQNFAVREQYLNASNTMSRLLEMGVVPVINENDSVATEEIKLGDNDTLAALVASMVGAEKLVIMSNVDGLWVRSGDGMRIAELVDPMDEDLSSCDDGTVSEHGTGGIRTKLRAARIASMSNVETYLVNGRRENVLLDILAGRRPGTVFVARSGRLRSKKRWIAFARRPKGRLVVDEGAAKALVAEKKSLLAVGITSVEGDFEAGDIVDILDVGGQLIARGITSYSTDELIDIIGSRKQRRGDEVVLPDVARMKEVINRDEMVVLV